MLFISAERRISSRYEYFVYKKNVPMHEQFCTLLSKFVKCNANITIIQLLFDKFDRVHLHLSQNFTQVLAQTDGKVSEADMLVIAVKSGEQSFQQRKQ